MQARLSRRYAALLAAAAAVAVCGCGASAANQASTSNQASSPSGAGLQGLVLTPAKRAPALSLRNYTGVPVDLASLRGRAVLVTFVYTHCPDVCPLIVSNLAIAQRQLGSQARHLQIAAVTVDPRGDTPAAVSAFLAAHDATGRMDYLLGTRSQLARTWRAWDVAVRLDNPAAAGHSAVVFGITASGREAVVYPSNFTPAQIAHDVPLLASS
jgi:protein SCO1/2